MLISKAAFDLIVAEEVSGEAVYRKRYTRPEWPGGASGVTIGIGYDVGYASEARLIADWSGHIPAAMIGVLTAACGVKGAAAKTLCAEIRNLVDVPWEAAIAVFETVDVPRWESLVRQKLANTELLHPDSLGAEVSLAYNRGASFGDAGDRYSEMRAIAADMQARAFALIPGEFRAMKRLWPNVAGLKGRREREAALFERGLKAKANPSAPLPPVITVNEANRTAAGKAATATTVSTTVATTGGTKIADNSKVVRSEHAAVFIVGGIVLALALGIAVFIWRARHRKTPKPDPEN